MECLTTATEWARGILAQPIFTLGNARITIGAVAYVPVLILALWLVAGGLQRWLINGPLLRTRLDASGRHAAGTFTRYAVLFIGLLVVVQTAGIDLTTLNVLAGALGLGIGFGLQSIVANFIAGLIIMFERPIKLGDRIVVGDTEGDVIRIGARSTTVLDNDGIAVLVPNIKFITENVVNWKYSSNDVRFKIPVSVAYGSDAAKVEAALLAVADADADTCSRTPPRRCGCGSLATTACTSSCGCGAVPWSTGKGRCLASSTSPSTSGSGPRASSSRSRSGICTCGAGHSRCGPGRPRMSSSVLAIAAIGRVAPR